MAATIEGLLSLVQAVSRWRGTQLSPVRRAEEPMPAAFEHKAGEDACGIGAGVDSDPVLPYLGRLCDAVPVDYDLAVVALVVEEGLADPKDILVLLVVERDAGKDAGMDEKIVALNVPALKPAQETHVPRRRFGCEMLAQAIEARAISSQGAEHADPVALQGRIAAVEEPAQPHLRILEETQHELFVIALEANRLEPRRRPFQQQLDHFSGIRPTIDIIAEIDDAVAQRRRPARILGDTVVEQAQKVHPPMDVADGVDAPTGRHLGLPRTDLGPRPRAKEPGDHGRVPNEVVNRCSP